MERPIDLDSNALISRPLSEPSRGLVPVENDRAAKLAAIPAGGSPANRGVQSLL